MTQPYQDRSAKFRLTEGDFHDAMRLRAFSTFRDKSTRRRLVLLWLVSVLAFAALQYAFGASWRELRQELPFVLIAFGAVWVLVPVILPLLFGRLAIRRRFRQDKLLALPVTVSWDQTIYRATQGGNNSAVNWSDYHRILASDQIFLFFTSDYFFQMLPKRVLSQPQIDDLTQIISATRPDCPGAVFQ